MRFISKDKPQKQKAIRFRNFRPVIGSARWVSKLSRIRQHNREWPNNTWDTKRRTIFPKIFYNT